VSSYSSNAIAIPKRGDFLFFISRCFTAQGWGLTAKLRPIIFMIFNQYCSSATECLSSYALMQKAGSPWNHKTGKPANCYGLTSHKTPVSGQF